MIHNYPLSLPFSFAMQDPTLLSPMFQVPEILIDDPFKDEEYWEPTPWGPFCTLEKSDESWARPLGLGRVVSNKRLREQMLMKYEAMFSLKLYSTPSSMFFLSGGF